MISNVLLQQLWQQYATIRDTPPAPPLDIIGCEEDASNIAVPLIAHCSIEDASNIAVPLIAHCSIENASNIAVPLIAPCSIEDASNIAVALIVPCSIEDASDIAVAACKEDASREIQPCADSDIQNTLSPLQVLPKHAAIDQALADLECLVAAVSSTSGLKLSIDLADLRGYQYHSGVMFAAYIDKLPQPIARGGRYDHVGQAFGRPRPATGFSLDLLTLASLSPLNVRKQAIVAPWLDDAALNQAIAKLRSAGEVVIQVMAGEAVEAAEYECDRELVKQGSSWEVKKK